MSIELLRFLEGLSKDDLVQRCLALKQAYNNLLDRNHNLIRRISELKSQLCDITNNEQYLLKELKNSEFFIQDYKRQIETLNNALWKCNGNDDADRLL